MTSYCCANNTCASCLRWRAERVARFERRLHLKYKRKPSPEKQNRIVDETVRLVEAPR